MSFIKALLLSLTVIGAATATHAEQPSQFVVLRVHMMTETGMRGTAVMDIFRVENGKLVQYWDVLQPIPEDIPRANTTF